MFIGRVVIITRFSIQSIFCFISLSHGVVIFSAFSNIYSGGFFLLTNKNLESAGTCGFQTKFRQIALPDALLIFFGDCSALRCENLSLSHHGSTHFSICVWRSLCIHTRGHCVSAQNHSFSFLCAGQNNDCI